MSEDEKVIKTYAWGEVPSDTAEAGGEPAVRKAQAVFIPPSVGAQGLWVVADPIRAGVVNLLPMDRAMAPLALTTQAALALRDILNAWQLGDGRLPESDELGWNDEGFVLREPGS